MNKALLLSIIVVAIPLTACTYSDINFESMSEVELMEYNRGRSVAQMVVCSNDTRSFSRVKRRRCATVEKMYGSEAQADQIGVLNSPAGAAGGIN